MTPGDAYKQYSDAEAVARDVFRDYWLDKFNQAGVPFVVDGPTSLKCCIYQVYQLEAYVWPRTHDGVDLDIRRPAAPPNNVWPQVTRVRVMSDSGFAKLLRNLQRGYFQ